MNKRSSTQSRIWRLDQLLVEKGFCSTRQKAQALILAGSVIVEDVTVTKAGSKFDENSNIRLREKEHPYVSRGALKLVAGLEQFSITPKGKLCLDIGSSTGGFTQVLLLNGAEKVVAIDVGKNQMAWTLRNDPRVELHEGVNARNLKFEDLSQTFELIVMDLSFISLTKVLPALIPFSTLKTDWLTLVKPQFEVGREKVEKGGIVRSEQSRLNAVSQVTEDAKRIGLIRRGLIESPITGTDGNIEYLAHWTREVETL